MKTEARSCSFRLSEGAPTSGRRRRTGLPLRMEWEEEQKDKEREEVVKFSGWDLGHCLPSDVKSSLKVVPTSFFLKLP